MIDTPGQLEPFVFKEAGKILQDLQTISPTVGVFLIDAALTQYASNLIVGLLLAIAVQIQLGFNMVYVLHKADLLSQRNKLVKMLEDPPYLRKQIIREHRGALTDLALSAHDAVSNLTGPMRIITTSAAGSQLGLEDLHDLLNESFCACGDLT